MKKVYLVSLGCPKNLVDSEIILGLLNKSGAKICDRIEQADIMLLNTCAFISEAREESIDLILDMINIKKENLGKKIIVIGCLVQRHINTLKKELPEVDLWVPLAKIPNIPRLINNLSGKRPPKDRQPSPVPSHFLDNKNRPRYMITPPYYTYIKISEGCDNRCSYCTIPLIKGGYRSRSQASILQEFRSLTRQGVKEINIISQDTTCYGKDLSSKTNITQLLRKMCQSGGVPWIRLLYTHPAHVTEDLIKEIALQDKICNYIDLPLQHIDNDILARMGRRTSSAYLIGLIKKIRDKIPQVILRTTFIVGFPGETDHQFHRLLEFMEKTRFDRLGIFIYSREKGTPAARMPDQVPEEVKEQRFHQAMQLQNGIARKVNSKFPGRTMPVLIEEPAPEQKDVWTGRCYADAPEVDGTVYIKTPPGKRAKLASGNIIQVKITGTTGYDLTGETV